MEREQIRITRCQRPSPTFLFCRWENRIREGEIRLKTTSMPMAKVELEPRVPSPASQFTRQRAGLELSPVGVALHVLPWTIPIRAPQDQCGSAAAAATQHNHHRRSCNRSMGLPHTPVAWRPCGEDGLLTEDTCAFRAYASKGATSAPAQFHRPKYHQAWDAHLFLGGTVKEGETLSLGGELATALPPRGVQSATACGRRWGGQHPRTIGTKLAHKHHCAVMASLGTARYKPEGGPTARVMLNP